MKGLKASAELLDDMETGIRRANELLEKGADTKIRAAIRKNFRYTDDERMHEYREVTALEYGEQCHNQRWVNKAALELLRTNES